MNTIDAEQHEKLLAAFNAGLSIRASARHSGVSKTTATSYFNQQPPMMCPCGRELPHRYWCHFRVAMSEGRQRFLLGSFTDGKVRAEVQEQWAATRQDILAALRGTKKLIRIDHEALAELRRFYDPSRPFAMEYVPGSRSVGESQIVMVGVQEAEQNQIPFDLYTALEKLHPAVKKMVLAIVDGATIKQAAQESKISDEALKLVMPPLKIFLSDHLRANL